MWNLWPVSVILGALCRLGSMATVSSFVSCIICQIAYLKYWQKNVFSCRGPWLRAPLKGVNLFPGRWPGQGWPRPVAVSPVLWERWIVSHSPPKRHEFPPCHWTCGRANADDGGASAPLHILSCCVPPAPPPVHGTTQDHHWQRQGTQGLRLPPATEFHGFHRYGFFFFFFMIGWNLANVFLFTTFSNSDQHFKVLLYTVVFLGVVCVGSPWI